MRIEAFAGGDDFGVELGSGFERAERIGIGFGLERGFGFGLERGFG